jgi:ribosomal protein L35
MAKIKTHKSTMKRFRVSKTGKLVYKAAGWAHMKAKKGAKIKYRKNVSRTLADASRRVLVKQLPGLSN